MKKITRIILAAVAALIAVQAEAAYPNVTVTLSPPTTYTNGTAIPAGDLTYGLLCGNTSGGPYAFAFDADGPQAETGYSVDVSACIQGTAGDYYFVATATSAVYGTTSNFSGEYHFVVTDLDIGNVPNAPVIINITFQ